jgi:serine palmitoyltransferase
MEGELARLPEIARVAKLYGAYIYLDEAHSIGAVGPTGRGVTEELNVNTDLVDIMMGTFTKSFGSAGGYVAASAELVEEIRQHSAGSNDSVSMSPGCCVQSTQALKVMMGEDGTDVGVTKIRQLRDNSKFFRDGLKNLGLEVLGDYPSPIMPVMLYQPYKIGDFSRLAFEKGLAVVVVGSPAVPLFLPRVRFCLSAAHSREELVDALDKVAEVADELSLRFERKSGRAPFYSSGGTMTAIDQGKNKLRVASEAKVESQRAAAMAAVAARGNPPPLGHGRVVASSGGSQRGWHVDGARPECVSMNVSAVDFLGLRKDEGMALACLKTVQRVGCGSCSPRGFYGTFPEHVKLEEDIAKFLGVGEAVLYSFGACTVSSVIQALLRPGDVAVVDEGVSFGLLAGLRLCKAQVVFYSHCNGQAAEQALELLEAEDGATSAQLFNSAKKRRRFIVTEAVFSATGQIAPLPALVALRQRYHARIILEESNSFGVLGRTGRGLTEHFDIPVSKVDVIAASLEGAGASVGGMLFHKHRNITNITSSSHR